MTQLPSSKLPIHPNSLIPYSVGEQRDPFCSRARDKHGNILTSEKHRKMDCITFRPGRSKHFSSPKLTVYDYLKCRPYSCDLRSSFGRAAKTIKNWFLANAEHLTFAPDCRVSFFGGIGLEDVSLFKNGVFDGFGGQNLVIEICVHLTVDTLGLSYRLEERPPFCHDTSTRLSALILHSFPLPRRTPDDVIHPQ